MYLEAPTTGAVDVGAVSGALRQPTAALSDGHLGDTNMHSGGSSREHGGEARARARSRTGSVIDQLLTRGPLLQGPTTHTRGFEPAPWTLVRPVLLSARPSLLGSHLSWLVTASTSDDHTARDPLAGPMAPTGDRTSWRRRTEDQVRILVRALDEVHQDTVVTVALDEPGPWSAADVEADDTAVMAYARALRRATTGQPAHSPYVALADSAFELAAAIETHRCAATTTPGPSDTALISLVRLDRARPSCPPSR